MLAKLLALTLWAVAKPGFLMLLALSHLMSYTVNGLSRFQDAMMCFHNLEHLVRRDNITEFLVSREYKDCLHWADHRFWDWDPCHHMLESWLPPGFCDK